MAVSQIDSTGLATGAVSASQLGATGTPSSSTFLRGDNTWAAPSGIPGILAQLYTTAGSYTFTIPTGVTALKVTVIGGGGGGSSAVAGGNSTVSSGTQTISTITGGGGGAGLQGYSTPGSASGGDINIAGGTGCRSLTNDPFTAGAGGAAGGGDGTTWAAANYGTSSSGGGGPWGKGGGSGAAATGIGSGGSGPSSSGGGGAGGGVAIKWLTSLTPGNTLAVTVGAAGGNGTAGAVFFEW